MYLVEQIILQYGWCQRKKLRKISLKKFEDPSKKKEEDRRDFVDAFGRTNRPPVWLVTEENIERNFFEKI
jgi:hypothetical protein